MLERRDVECDPSVVDERAVQARGLSVGEQIREQVRLGVAVGEHRRRVPRHVDARQLDAIFEHEPDFPRHRRGGLDVRRFPAARDFAEVLFRELERAFRIDVAGKRQRCVGRMVVRAEEGLHVFELHRAQILDRTDRQPVIGMVGRKQRRAQCHQRHPVRPVLVVLPPLVEHDIALRLEPLARQRRQQVPHAIGFHPERQLQRASRHDFPVVGAIAVGGSVEQRSRLLERQEETAVVMLGPFEHQVFEQVREPGTADTFVLRSDVVPEIDRHNRRSVILRQGDEQSVIEAKGFYWNSH